MQINVIFLWKKRHLETSTQRHFEGDDADKQQKKKRKNTFLSLLYVIICINAKKVVNLQAF